MNLLAGSFPSVIILIQWTSRLEYSPTRVIRAYKMCDWLANVTLLCILKLKSTGMLELVDRRLVQVDFWCVSYVFHCEPSSLD